MADVVLFAGTLEILALDYDLAFPCRSLQHSAVAQHIALQRRCLTFCKLYLGTTVLRRRSKSLSCGWGIPNLVAVVEPTACSLTQRAFFFAILVC